jgi:hypothetical protein
VIERHGVVAHSVAETMGHIAAAAVAAASVVIAAEVEEALEVEVVAFVVVVAVANGTVGRFRSGGDFPDAQAAGLDMGRCQHEVDTDETAARALMEQSTFGPSRHKDVTKLQTWVCTMSHNKVLTFRHPLPDDGVYRPSTVSTERSVIN